VRFESNIILRKKRKQPLPISAHRIQQAWYDEFHRAGRPAKESLKRRERNDPAALASGVLIEVNALALKTKTYAVTAASRKSGACQRYVVESIETREAIVAAIFRNDAADREVAELLSRNPRHRRRYIDRPHVIGQRGRTVNAESNLI